MNDVALVIRLCEPSDTPMIVPLLQARVAASGRQAPDPDALAEIVHALLATQFSDFVLAEAGERASGVVQINYRLSTEEARAYAVIEDFYLAPNLRGQGAGTRMLDYACARAVARGCHTIHAATRSDDRAAARLYEAFGFSETPQRLWRSTLPLGCAMDLEEPAAMPDKDTNEP